MRRLTTTFIGAKDYFDGKATAVSGIETPDAQTIVFRLEAPEGYFLNILALMSSFVSDHQLNTDVTAMARHPVGTGPFKVDTWQPNVSMNLVRNQFYTRSPTPQMAHIDITFGPPPADAA